MDLFVASAGLGAQNAGMIVNWAQVRGQMRGHEPRGSDFERAWRELQNQHGQMHADLRESHGQKHSELEDALRQLRDGHGRVHAELRDARDQRRSEPHSFEGGRPGRRGGETVEEWRFGGGRRTLLPFVSPHPPSGRCGRMDARLRASILSLLSGRPPG